MSPEQFRADDPPNVRSDLWSLGATLYELLTGTTPFGADELQGLIASIAGTPHTPPLLLRPELPESLASVLDRCLQKNPLDRYGSLGEFVAALRPYANRRGQAAAERVLRWHRAPEEPKSPAAWSDAQGLSPTVEWRTSDTHPQHVDFADCPSVLVPGKMGMTDCPGRRDPGVRGELWFRSMTAGLSRLQTIFGADVLVTLLWEHELLWLGVESLGAQCAELGLRHIALPVKDGWIPEDLQTFADSVALLLAEARAGKCVVVHCRNGLGRTGLVVACVLVAGGMGAAEARQRVRRVRPGAIESDAQESFVSRFDAFLQARLKVGC